MKQTKRKKPPPDTPANLAGRRNARRRQAWANACGGIRIIVGKEGERVPSGQERGTYKPPDDVQERFKKELARLEAEWEKKRQERAEKPQKAKTETPPDTEGVDAIDFLLS